MNSNRKQWFLSLLAAFTFVSAFGQQEPGPFDFGKMWTFENPPKAWFLKAYNYDLDEEWFNEAMSPALKFVSWCSASFVSPNGLVMTNHHCSREVVFGLQKEGENFNDNGFYARSLAEERRNPEVYVEQLIKVADITDEITALISSATSDAERLTKTQQARSAVIKEFSSKPGWENLRIETVPMYSGAKFSIYGYKRHNDVRLVFLPEEQLGFFGGDADNFTYPRYNLDCTFWRVYDESGKPLNTSGTYFPFNLDGIQENTPVFVVGYPGTTERYRTIAQLEYDRDYRYPIDIEYNTNRMKILKEEYAENPNDEIKSDLFILANDIKSTKGTLKGLNDPELFNRKVKMEEKIKANAPDKPYWDNMNRHYEVLSKNVSELRFLSPTPMSGGVLSMMHVINEYNKIATANAESPELEGLGKKLTDMAALVKDPEEIRSFAMVLGELKKFAQPDDDYIITTLNGRSPDEAAAEILSTTLFADEKELSKLLDKNAKKFLKSKDPLIETSKSFVTAFSTAVTTFRSTGVARKEIEQHVAGEAFKVFGEDLPPDANFTLRISDGIVKGYEYNGTVAPIKTTYFGMYEKYEAFDGTYPWSLPDRWLKPQMELLKAPMNYVATTDIVGGNSGSAIINVTRELVGLAFDGNMESLPGKFIFDEKDNRTVCVHPGGIIAALRYIYKADRLIEELTGK